MQIHFDRFSPLPLARLKIIVSRRKDKNTFALITALTDPFNSNKRGVNLEQRLLFFLFFFFSFGNFRNNCNKGWFEAKVKRGVYTCGCVDSFFFLSFFFSFDNFRNSCNKGWFVKIEAKVKRGVYLWLSGINEASINRMILRNKFRNRVYLIKKRYDEGVLMNSFNRFIFFSFNN